MKNAVPAPDRKPQINLQLEVEEKDLFEKVAKARGLKVSALIRLLVIDEGRRLGIKTDL